MAAKLASLLVISVCMLGTSWAQIAESAGYYKEVYPEVDLNGNLSNHLFFALVQSFGGWLNSSGNIAGVKVALDRINNDSSVLPNHVLHYTLTDSQCDHTIALDALFKQLLSEDNISKLAVVGCGCSVATEPTAEVSHYYNVTHISCSSASTELTDRSRFRRYFQLLQTMVDISDIYKGLINHYQWDYVSLITQNENLFTVVTDSLKQYLVLNEIAYTEKLFESDTSIAGLREPIDPNARIFIVSSYESHTRAFLCEAYRRGLSYPSHLLILVGWYEGKWWLRQTEEEGRYVNCTDKQRESILEHALTVHHFNLYVPDEIQTTSGITGLEFKAEEDDQIRIPPEYTRAQFSPYCFDAVWTLAYALNQTMQEYSSSDIDYGRLAFHDKLLEVVSESHFTGVTGPIRFSAEGIRATNDRQVFQLRNESGGDTLDIVQVGEVVESDGEFQFEISPSFPEEILWPAGLPRDGVAENTTVTVHPATTAVLVLFATAGIVFTTVCLIFNLVFRNKKVIKLSSPNLNYLICAGAIILYIDTYIVGIPATNIRTAAAICTAIRWLTAIGYSLCYGTIIWKMIRIHYIFRNPKPKPHTALKDWKLAVGVLVLVLVDLVILVTYTIYEWTIGVRIVEVLNKENPSSSDEVFGIVEYHYILICNQSTSNSVVLGVIYGYKGLLQFVTLILAFTTRKVKIKGVNDTLYIAATIYVTSILLALAIVSSFLLKEYANLYAVLFGLGLSLGTTVVVALVFIPKMVMLYNDPEGENIFTTTNGTGRLGESDYVTEISSLRKKVTELQETLTKVKTEDCI